MNMDKFKNREWYILRLPQKLFLKMIISFPKLIEQKYRTVNYFESIIF